MRCLKTVTNVIIVAIHIVIILLCFSGLLIFIMAMDAGLFCPVSLWLMDMTEIRILKGIFALTGGVEAVLSAVLYLAALGFLACWSLTRIERIFPHREDTTSPLSSHQTPNEDVQ